MGKFKLTEEKLKELAIQSATKGQMSALENILNNILDNKHKYIGLTDQKDREYAIKIIKETNDTLIKCKNDYVSQNPNEEYPISILNWYADELILGAKNNLEALELLVEIENK